MSEQSRPKKLLSSISAELGLSSLFQAPLDTKILCLQRFIRLFAYGASTLILATYMSELGHDSALIGLFMTLTLVGDVVMSFCLTLVADQVGRRRILALGAALMVGSGIVFAVSENYYVLLAAAILGVITPSGNEIGPFRAVEESALAHLTPAEHRSHVFAWYTLIGTAGAALGLMAAGWTTEQLMRKSHWSVIDSYKAVFVAYAVLGLLKFLLTLCLSSNCEVDREPDKKNDPSETGPLLQQAQNSTPPVDAKRSWFLPAISRQGRSTLLQLSLLFALDSIASGLAPLSWVTYYFKRRFGMAEGQLGSLFFGTSIVQAASVLVAASVAKRIGNVKTMVFTHLPSAICLALIGIPSQLGLAIMFVVLRASTQSMDSAPRSAFLAEIILPNERTASLGVINVVKTASQSLGPTITGVLAGKNLFWVAFLMAGSLKATYDIGILLTFVGHRAAKGRNEEVEDTQEESGREEGRSQAERS